MTPSLRLLALAVRLDDCLTELGTRTMKTGPMAGQVARWGRHLPTGHMPFGTHAGFGETRGILQVHDPATKATMTIERSRRAYGANPERWAGGKHAYISNISMPKKYRETMAGGKALGRMTAGVLGHFDKRSITASTVAGSYEGSSVAERAAGTHKLVQSYQKRGFRIDPSGSQGMPNEWNVAMLRRPGAGKQRPMSEGTFRNRMGRMSQRSRAHSVGEIKSNLAGLAKPGAVIAGTGAAVGGTAYAAEHDGPRQTLAANALVPGTLAGTAIAGGAAAHLAGHLRAKTGDTLDHTIAAAQAARMDIGRAIARRKNRVAQFIGRGFLHGLV